MSFDLLAFVAHGLMPLPWWGYLVVALAMTHVTIACVTIFLHRAQAHRALDLHPAISHFFRFWLWLTTGMVTKEWVAIHRKHHARVETPDDPHSPQTRGINTVFWRARSSIAPKRRMQETIDKFGRGTPDDWMERNVYTRFSWEGVGLMLMVNFMLFGGAGVAIWAVQMAWIPVTAAGSSTASATIGVIAISLLPTPRRTSCPGAFSSAARSSTTTITRMEHRRSCRRAGTNSIWDGPTSGSSKRWALPRCAMSRRPCGVAPAGKATPDVDTPRR